MSKKRSEPRPEWRDPSAAHAEHLRRAAIRALDDPVTLARAARIVRAALERQKLTLADLTGEPDEQAAS